MAAGVPLPLVSSLRRAAAAPAEAAAALAVSCRLLLSMPTPPVGPAAAAPAGGMAGAGLQSHTQCGTSQAKQRRARGHNGFTGIFFLPPVRPGIFHLFCCNLRVSSTCPLLLTATVTFVQRAPYNMATVKTVAVLRLVLAACLAATTWVPGAQGALGIALSGNCAAPDRAGGGQAWCLRGS